MTIIPLTNSSLRGSIGNPPIASWHPEYGQEFQNWEKWRYAYEGGRDFVDKYMIKLSSRESEADFTDRKAIAYPPTFAKAAINDVKNSIFQRTADVTRVDGPETYRQAVKGLDGGVDLQGNSMGSFVGTEILSELLVMAKVGVLVDAPNNIGVTMADKGKKKPFLDVYRREDIINWAPKNPVNGFDSLLIRESVDKLDQWGLPSETCFIYRLYRKVQDGVLVQFFDATGEDSEPIDEVFLNLPKIPFVVFNVPLSLMEDVADYQVALLNLESSDISFARKANYPFYYEFYDPRQDMEFGKPPATPGDKGTAAEATAKDREITVGMAHGRKIPKDLNAPGFINPDPETLRVSMEKGSQLKEDIRLLVNLNLLNMNPRRQAADSKALDSHSLEASLSFIGLVLQRGEMEIGEHWNNFERTGKTPKITYPKSYNLKTEQDRQEEAERLEKLQNKIPSDTYRRAVAKKIAQLTMMELSEEDLQKITKEIDNAETLTSDTDHILAAVEAGLIDDERAAVALGFPKEAVEQARKDRAERIRLTLEAQGGPENASQARGADDFGGTESTDEKSGKPVRGESRKVE